MRGLLTVLDDEDGSLDWDWDCAATAIWFSESGMVVVVGGRSSFWRWLRVELACSMARKP